MDTFEGDDESPASLHKYLYASVDPVNSTDSSGFYTQSDGYAAERAIKVIYAKDNLGDDVIYGGWARIEGGYHPKPDIITGRN